MKENYELVLTEDELVKLSQVNYEYDKTTKEINRNIQNIFKNFLTIAVLLHEVKNKSLYEVVGYIDIYDYAFNEFDLGKTTVKNLIQIADKACLANDEDETLRTTNLKEQYENYGYSQIVELISLDDTKLENYNPEMSVREIKENKFRDKMENHYNFMIDLDDSNSTVNQILKHFSNKFPEHTFKIENYGHSWYGNQFNIIVDDLKGKVFWFAIQLNTWQSYNISFNIYGEKYETYDEFIAVAEEELEKNLKDLKLKKEKESQTFDQNEDDEEIEVGDVEFLQTDEDDDEDSNSWEEDGEWTTGTIDDFIDGFVWPVHFKNDLIDLFRENFCKWNEVDEEVHIYLDESTYLSFNYDFYEVAVEEFEIKVFDSDNECLEVFDLNNLFKLIKDKY